ncbi:MAG: ACT domain-containing protein [Candidatus Micrarchaeota archaeon]
MPRISEVVWLYIKRRPIVKAALRDGIVNHSALARTICRELGFPEKNFDAVKVALTRISKKVAEKEAGMEEKVLELLEKSSITIQTKVAVVISRKDPGIKAISHARSGGYNTYIVEENETKKIKEEWGVKSVQKNLNLITIKSGEELEEVPGVISFILNALAYEGINVVEFISCYTDTLLVVKEADTRIAYEILSSITGGK